MKNSLNWRTFKYNFFSIICFYSIWVFFHEHWQFTGQQEKGKAISLTALYHFNRLQGWKHLVHVCGVHQTCTKHRLEGHEISCTNIIFHGNQYVLLFHHVFMAINKIKITWFDLQAMTVSQSVQVPHCSLHT